MDIETAYEKIEKLLDRVSKLEAEKKEIDRKLEALRTAINSTHKKASWGFRNRWNDMINFIKGN